MRSRNKYRDSLLSAFCVISWFIIVFRIFKEGMSDSYFIGFLITCVVTMLVGVIGGVIFLFVGALKKRNLRFSFIYNLFATLNIMVGSLGMMLPVFDGRPTPYIVSASLTVGIAMYITIYSPNRRIFLSK